MRHRLALRKHGMLIGALSLLAGVSVAPALAAGPGLPRTYRVQRIDSPNPQPSGLFSLALNLAGDLNRDGEDDLIAPQVPGFNTDGQIFVFSGETGGLLDTINGPDPDPGGTNDGRAQFGLLGTAKVGFDRTTAPFSDLGSCPGGNSGQTCQLPTVGPADGVPDLLIGATGVDVGGVTDAGRVYLIDGATRAVLKRIDMPPEDRTPLALTTGSTGFGREVLAPEGLPGCEGNAGVGTCPSDVPRTVQIGDLDGGGQPDIIVGARRVTENSTTANPASQCARTPGAICRGAGRAYIYRGEDIVGSSPGEILDGAGPRETVKKLRNPDAQADNPASAVNTDSEGFGNDLLAIGDVGTCNQAGIAPGDKCLRANSTTTPDGRPDFVVPAPAVDYPLDNPDAAFGDAGAAYLVDGATGSILHTYEHPEPQRGAGFGGTFEETLAPGDLGDTGVPDVDLGAPNQNARFTSGGRAYAMNGNFKASSTLINFARLDDPTPAVTEENFGGSAAGVGDLVGGAATPANELMVGESGPRVGPFVAEAQPIDVHFFNVSTERVLQSVQDPDGQTSDAFGDSIEPLGDLNEDGFLDFAVGAFRFEGSGGLAAGRFYIFRSDNSPASAPAAPGAQGGAGQAIVLAGRAIRLVASTHRIAIASRARRRRTLRLRGRIEAFANKAGCERGQTVLLQRRRSRRSRYRTFTRTRSDRRGAFRVSLRPRRTYLYRALVPRTRQCRGATSNQERVRVARPARR